MPPRRFWAWVDRLIFSWPPATTIVASPVWIAWAASATARRPEPQTWLTPQAGTSLGMPAAIDAWRAGFWPWAAVSTWPRMTSDTSSGGDARLRQRRLDGDAAELVGGGGGEGAEEGADRGALGGGDDDVGHEWLLGSSGPLA